MRQFFPVEDLARDERFVQTNMAERMQDARQPRLRDAPASGTRSSAKSRAATARLTPDRPDASDAARSLMHGIMTGEIQALEGAGRTAHDFASGDGTNDTIPFELKLDMARQAWDEARHVEISVKLSAWMGTELGQFAENTVLFEAHRGDLRLELPVAPMLGTVGVAPAGREVRSSLVPDKFGGNMDTPEMCPGTTVYLGVNVEGALFSVGDGHYRQGEGESCGTAVEGAMDVTLIAELIKGGAPEWPRLEHDDDYVVVGSARPLEDAWRASQVGMIAWLGELFGLDRLDAYQLLTQVSASPIANVVDVNYSAVTKVAKQFLPAADAYGGMHRYLREQAATL